MALTAFLLLVLAPLVLVECGKGDRPPNEDSTPPSTSILKPWMFLSSKTPYYQQQLGAREEMPKHCKLVQLTAHVPTSDCFLHHTVLQVTL